MEDLVKCVRINLQEEHYGCTQSKKYLFNWGYVNISNFSLFLLLIQTGTSVYNKIKYVTTESTVLITITWVYEEIYKEST